MPNELLLSKPTEEKIDLYVNGRLTDKEIDELWAELIQDVLSRLFKNGSQYKSSHKS